MPFPVEQPNWSPKTGLNLTKSLPGLSGDFGAQPVTSMLSHTALPNQGSASLAITTNSGSLAGAHHRPTSPIRAQLLSGASVPSSPPSMIGIGRLGRPPPYTPPARSVRSATMDANIHRHQIGRLATPYMSSSPSLASHHSAGGDLRVSQNTEELPRSHPTNTRLGCTTEMTPGAVWAPVGRTHLSRDGPAPLYTHDISHPNWQSGADYGSIVDWRSTRVITDDTSALSFNNVCRAARSLNYLDHQSDPLPWCRDGRIPDRELAASQNYDLDVTRPVRPDSSSGEDECLRNLLDSEDDSIKAGPSAQRLRSARMPSTNKTTVHPTPAVMSSNTLIRKDSPVTHRGDVSKTPRTRPRLDPTHDVDQESEVDELDPDEPQIPRMSPSTASNAIQPHVKHGKSPPKRKKPTKDCDSVSTGSNRWHWDDPGELDLIWLTHLIDFQPFSVYKEQTERFHKCTLHLKEHPDTRDRFRTMNDSKTTTTLKNRFNRLKVWVRQADAASEAASGINEDDGPLRKLIKEFQAEEEEMITAVKEAKAAKEAAAAGLARANDLRDSRAARTNSAPLPSRKDLNGEESDGSEGDEGARRPPTSLRALREGLSQKLQSNDGMTHMIDVTLKSSQAAEKANELTLIALERHQQQTTVTNSQRERELGQSQARLDLDSETARETLALRREELAAARERKDKKDVQIEDLKSSMGNVQGTLNDMGPVLKLLAEHIAASNSST